MITTSFGLTATERVLPRLALDFTTASLDPRVTFTRTTSASNPATFVDSSGYITLATNDQPRFDHDPITLACNGLLIEESRTNLLQFSEDFSNAYYTKTNTTISANATTAPDNNVTADKIIENASAGFHQAFRQPAISASTTYTLSCFVKAAERTWVFLNLNNPGVADFITWFNLSTGTIGTVASGVTATIKKYKDDWYRVTVTRTSAAGQTSTVCSVGLATGNGVSSYTGNGTSGAYIWGFQLELGAFPTSYIPTTTTATRNADVATMTGTNFSDWFNASEGTLVAKYASIAGSVSADQYIAAIGNGTTTDLIRLSKYAGVTYGQVRVSNVAQANFTIGTTNAAGAIYSASFSYKLDNFSSALNGSNLNTSTSGTLPSGMNGFWIGSRPNNSSYFNGYLCKINIYTQKLINNEVVAFSK